jgi:hypothetical protein
LRNTEPIDNMANQVAAYVLGAVSTREAESTRALLASSAPCREVEFRLREAVSQLPLAVLEAIPPARLRARILGAADPEASTRERIPAGWSDEMLPLRSHICYHYSNKEWLRRSLAFLRIGLDSPRELCLLFADRADHAPLLELLQEGYPRRVEERMEQGKLIVLSPAPTREEMARDFATGLREGVDAGFTTIRRLALDRPSWPPADVIVSMEEDVDQLAATYPAVNVCSYGPDVDSDLLLGAGLHSHICVNGRTKVNPFYSGACGDWAGGPG